MIDILALADIVFCDHSTMVFVANWPEYVNQLRKHLGFANCNFCSAP